MLRSDHAQNDVRNLEKLARIEKEDKAEVKLQKAIIKSLTLIIKFLKSIRSNQVRVMKEVHKMEFHKPVDRTDRTEVEPSKTDTSSK